MNASFEEASRVCGASSLRTLAKIVVPIMTPALLIVFLLSTIRGLQTFEIEMILGAPIGLFVYSTKIYTLLFLRTARLRLGHRAQHDHAFYFVAVHPVATMDDWPETVHHG